MEEYGESECLEEPVSPQGQYFNSSVLSLCVLAVLEIEIPIDDPLPFTLLRDVFLQINPRFSSIVTVNKNGIKKWKRVEVKLKDHVKVPQFPEGKSLEYYDNYFKDYLSKIAMDPLPQNQPLWEIHIVKYPTRNAAGNIIFKLHHSLGDGFSLMGALLSCLQRADNPSIPLTFPTRQSNTNGDKENKSSILKVVPHAISWFANNVVDFGWSMAKSSFLSDGITPIRSGEDGIEFRPSTITTLTFSLDQIKQIKGKLGVTINDVITGTIFLGSRLYMQSSSQEEKGKNGKCTALVLLNTRAFGGYKTISEMVKPNAEMPWGNHFTFLHVPIPEFTKSKSFKPIYFVKKAQNIIKRKRNSAALYLTGKLVDFLRRVRGPEPTARYVYNTLNNSSMVITNMIGPVEKMSLSNHPIKGLYFGVVGGPEGMSITIMSYVGELRMAIRVVKGYVDPQRFTSCIEEAFNMILSSSTSS